MANSSRHLGDAADSGSINVSSMTVEDTTEDAPIMLDLTLEEDIAANLDHYILLTRQGYFIDADKFFDIHLKKHAGWFPVIWEYCNSQSIQSPQFDPAVNAFVKDSSCIHQYDLGETVLLDLMINIERRGEASIEQLQRMLREEVMREIDVRSANTI